MGVEARNIPFWGGWRASFFGYKHYRNRHHSIAGIRRGGAGIDGEEVKNTRLVQIMNALTGQVCFTVVVPAATVGMTGGAGEVLDLLRIFVDLLRRILAGPTDYPDPALRGTSRW